MPAEESVEPIVRRAVPGDIDSLVEHRLSLLRESGYLAADAEADVSRAVRLYFERHLASGDFVSWVAEVEGRVVAASGVVIWHRPPTTGDASGAEAYVMNMFTVPDWRRHGLASRLLEEILSYVRSFEIKSVRLHATRDGAQVYARYGFVPGETEMVLRLP